MSNNNDHDQSDGCRGVKFGLKIFSGKINWVGNGQMIKIGLHPWVSNLSFSIPVLKGDFLHLASTLVSTLCAEDGHWNANFINLGF